MRYILSIIGIIVFWLIGMGWTWLLGYEMTYQNINNTMVAFLVGIVVAKIVGDICD